MFHLQCMLRWVSVNLLSILQCRFVQPYPELYALSEKFVMKMAHHFEVAFPEVMANFAKILINEGLNSTEGHFGGTPFTSFAITRDYSCQPHDDPNDYGFGIMVWLHPCKSFQFV